MEMVGDYLLIGIGCNVFAAPPVVDHGENGGRRATCLVDHTKDSYERPTGVPADSSVETSVRVDGTTTDAADLTGILARGIVDR